MTSDPSSNTPQTTAMDFGQALRALKEGNPVRRTGWNGKGMYLTLENFGWHNGRLYEPCIVMFTAQQKHQPGWLASQADLLAEDWEIAT